MIEFSPDSFRSTSSLILAIRGESGSTVMSSTPKGKHSPGREQSGAETVGGVESGPTAQGNADTIEAADVDEDPGYETDSASGASTSISSSVRDFAFENGRRYHKFREGSYQFPNDEPEQAREDMKHGMIVNLCNGKLHYAPLENRQQILDLGTGTGIWCIDSVLFFPPMVGS